MFKIRLWFYWMVAGVILISTIMGLSYWVTQVSQDWVTLQQSPTDASKKKFDASLEIAKAIVGGVGTIATISGGFFVLWNIRLTQTRLITERFSKAVEQLGSDKIEVRLGSIYALERIAQDSDRDHWTIMEVLTSFIQEKSSIKRISEERIRAKAYEIWQKGSKGTDEQHWSSAIGNLTAELMTKDIQASLTVIGRRQLKDPPDKRLDFRSASLYSAELSHAKLSGAVLNGANLSNAVFIGAFLNEANLTGANLSRAVLINANLSRAVLVNANLSGANLNGAILIGASLSGANLSFAGLNESKLLNANLSGANLSGAILLDANFSGANFSRGNFRDANFRGAILLDANFSGANLSTSKNLTIKQLERAKLCKTELPEGIALDPNRNCKVLEF